MAGKKHQREYLPAFKQAFKGLAALAHTNPKTLVAEHQQLTPEARFVKLKKQFQFFQSLPYQPMVADTMETFLKNVAEAVQSAELETALKEINAKHNDYEKFIALQALFKKEQTLAAFAKCWEMYLQSQTSTFDKLADLFGKNYQDVYKSIKHVDSQSDYDPVKKIFRDMMRALFMLFDAVLISAGYDAVFVPHDTEHQASRNPTTGMFQGENGAYYP